VRCAKCHHDNPDDAVFCMKCGTRVESGCSSCGATNPAGANFCGKCGTALGAPAAISPAAILANETGIRVNDTPARESLGGERRHLTVLFCDLVGSTEMAARLDPEEWREIVAAYHRGAAAAVARFGGHVAKYLGDGVMAFFGYPEAHDNDAERAARAGLAILDAIAVLNGHSARPKLSARVGIDSGAVVVGAGAGKEADVFGDAPNIAARVEAVAEPGTVAITGTTHRLVSGLFVVEERGARVLKGVVEPVELYRVVRPSGMRGRFAAAAAVRGLTPFVGREDELHLMMSRWERVCEGEGQAITIVGEAGIGKSRLVQHFREQIAADRHTWLECATAAFCQNTPFYAIADMLQQTFHWHSNQNTERRLAALEASLALTGVKLDEGVPLIASLLELPVDDKYAALALAPDQRRRRLLATIAEWTIGFAKAQPLVMAVEDLHWADPSTLELMQILVEQSAIAPLMLLCTVRPEFQAQWPMRAHNTQITLNRLSSRNVRKMVGQVAARRSLSDETIATMVERTGGVPLFIEELTLAVLEGGDTANREIPATLHDSLMARLDRLGAAKEVAQVGAVIGREFSYDLLHAVHPIDEADLQKALRNLADAELLFVRGIAPDANYQFKHALIRDAAYEALLKTRRRELHRRIARTLKEQIADLAEAHPEVLARHWTEAGETELAITEWTRAGRAAEMRNAFKEALESYQQAVALVRLLPDGAERNRRELALEQSIVAVLQITRGYAAAETVQASERAALLAEKSGNLAEFASSLAVTASTTVLAGNVVAASKLAQRAFELAVREGGRNTLASVETANILTHYWGGDLAGMEKHFETQSALLEDPEIKRLQGRNPVPVFAYGAWNAWTLGRVDLAREREGMMMRSIRADSPYDVAWTGYYSAHLIVFMREYAEAESLAERALELSQKNQFPYITGAAQCVLGYARAHLGRPSQGIDLINQGISTMIENGAHLLLSNFTSYLAAAQERDGAITEALETVERALQVNPDILAYRPETLRLRGEIRLEQGKGELGEASLREAIALARKIGAKAWELRATTSLARLLRDTGRRDEARMMLAGIYGWFTEGFDTRDLKEARALLDELNSES
jgi:class 3 adenylate cyclase/tetratricopeptide (TPR) repeat protein/ribosomal protein L40E